MKKLLKIAYHVYMTIVLTVLAGSFAYVALWLYDATSWSR